MSPIADNLAALRAEISATAQANHRNDSDVRLIAVSKTFGAATIMAALEAGQRVFGENYVQETKQKWPALREAFPDVALHMIGPLQSNKAREAMALFDVIHTLDRPSLARELAREMDKQGRRPKLFVQVNTGEEPQKGGIAPDRLATFLRECRTSYGLEISGLMCIPPHDAPPAPHFALLAQMARDEGLSDLSMGMSEDFKTAIALGATHVRVGSAIFGTRTALL